MKNITYKGSEKLTAWRKTSLASWKPTGDSSCYCFEDVIIDKVLTYCKKNGINLYSFLIKAISNTIHKEPKINATVRWGKIYAREEVSIFFHTVMNEKVDDLSGIIIADGQKKDIKEVDKEFVHKIKGAKKGITPFVASKKIIGKLPALWVRSMLNFYSFVTYTLNKCLRIFKLQPNAFGSVMVTAVGSLGITRALCPIAPYTKVPMVISVGKIEKKPVVVNDEIVIKNMLTFGFTFDHRIMDGIRYAIFFNCLKAYFEKPNLIENEEA